MFVVVVLVVFVILIPWQTYNLSLTGFFICLLGKTKMCEKITSVMAACALLQLFTGKNLVFTPNLGEIFSFWKKKKVQQLILRGGKTSQIGV